MADVQVHERKVATGAAAVVHRVQRRELGPAYLTELKIRKNELAVVVKVEGWEVEVWDEVGVVDDDQLRAPANKR